MWLWLIAAALAGDAMEREQALQAQMNAHWAETELMRWAVISGDLKAAKSHARSLRRRLPLEELPSDLQDGLMDASVALKRSKSLAQAADAMGSVSVACAGCHGRVDVQPGVPTPSEPPTGPTVPEQMDRHGWALELMWTGMLRNDAEVYNQGATALASEEIVATSAGRVDPAPATVPVGDWESAVHRSAELALQAEDIENRGLMLGRVIAACSACHAHVEPR